MREIFNNHINKLENEKYNCFIDISNENPNLSLSIVIRKLLLKNIMTIIIKIKWEEKIIIKKGLSNLLIVIQIMPIIKIIMFLHYNANNKKNIKIIKM